MEKKKNSIYNGKNKANNTSEYGDDDIPEIDTKNLTAGEEDDRPRKDGPGGE